MAYDKDRRDADLHTNVALLVQSVKALDERQAKMEEEMKELRNMMAALQLRSALIVGVTMAIAGFVAIALNLKRLFTGG